MKNPCEEIALEDGQFCTLTPPTPLKFKIGDKVIIVLNKKGVVASIVNINLCLMFPYRLNFDPYITDFPAVEHELCIATPLMEALL